jgi:hypothetical protein
MLLKLLQHVDHFQQTQRSFSAFVPNFNASTVNRLFDGVSG